MSIVTETWRPDAFGFPYDICTDSSVRNQKTGHVLKPSIDKHGYARVRLCKDGKSRQIFVHRLVLEAFVGPMPPGKECSHINGDPLDNRLENLEYDTHKGNEAAKIAHGTTNRGSRNSSAKLSPEDVRTIRSLRGKVKNIDLARRYGVHDSRIARIQRGTAWLSA